MLDHAVNWEAISTIGQIVGAIGVVVSLIYVATEVRNSARATQLASRRSILLNLHSVVSTTRRASGFKRIVLSRSPRLRISRRHRSRRLRSGHAPAVSSLRGGLLWTLGGGCGSTSVAWVGSGHARYQRISWSSGLLAFTLALVQ